MSPENLIIAALLIPLAVTVGVFLTGRVPNLREAVTIAGAVALLGVSILLA